MIRYDPDKHAVIMDLVDLEHCGFHHDQFDWELGAVGIEDRAARWPIVLVVNFAGGHVVWQGDGEDVVADRQVASDEFMRIHKEVLEKYADAFETLASGDCDDS